MIADRGKNNKKAAQFEPPFFVWLVLCVYQPPGTFPEKYIDLVIADQGADLAAAKYRVHHRLSFTVLSRPVIG